MSSNYTGTPGTIALTVSLPDDGDRPSAALFRVPYEALLNNDAQLAALVGVVSGAFVDGANGGSYAPTGNIVITSSELRAAIYRCTSGSQVLIDGGGEIVLSGLGGGGKLTCNSGGLIRLARSQDLSITAAANTFRSVMVPVHVGHGNDWTSTSGSWLLHNTVNGNSLMIPINAPPGDILTSVTFRVMGGAGAGHTIGGLPATMPKYSIVKVLADGTVTALAHVTDPSGSAAAFDADHTVVLDHTSDATFMPLTLTGDPHYFFIEGERGGNSITDTFALNSISGNITANTYRGAAEFI